MNERPGVRSEQVGEGSDASLPTATDLEALQEGLKEGLAKGPAVESNPQDTTNEPVVTRKSWPLGPQGISAKAQRQKTGLVSYD